MHTGECTCKRLVTGKDCNQCMPETYGLSDSKDGCTLCNCDPGGALDNHCDVITGQCRCRTHMTGRQCNIPKQHHFIPSIHLVYEAETETMTECLSHSSYNVSYDDSKEKTPLQSTNRNNFFSRTALSPIVNHREIEKAIGLVPVMFEYLKATKSSSPLTLYRKQRNTM